MKRKAQTPGPQKLKDLIQQVSWSKVAEELALCHPEKQQNLEDYQLVFNTLRELDPIPSSTRIVISSLGPEPGSEDPAYFVYGKKSPCDDGSTLAFTPWAEWLGMSVSPAPCLTLSSERIAAICLYDICYYGFSELSIQEERRAIEEELGL